MRFPGTAGGAHEASLWRGIVLVLVLILLFIQEVYDPAAHKGDSQDSAHIQKDPAQQQVAEEAKQRRAKNVMMSKR